MSWQDTDDTETQDCIDRLLAQQTESQSYLNQVQTIINNARQIKTQTQSSYEIIDIERVQVITKIIPKDKWGDDMSDDYRLQTKDEVIAKTIELLGEPVDE